MNELEHLGAGVGGRVSSVWVGEQEDLPKKEASHAGKWGACQAGGRAHAKVLRLKLVWPVGGTAWRPMQPGRVARDKAGL